MRSETYLVDPTSKLQAIKTGLPKFGRYIISDYLCKNPIVVENLRILAQ